MHDKCLSQAQVYNWSKQFSEGCNVVENVPHNRRPQMSVIQGKGKRVFDVDFLTQQRRINTE